MFSGANHNMNRPVSSLNLPQSVVNKLEKEGFCLCDDVKENFEAAQAKVNICCWPSVTTAPKLKTALELCREELNWKSVTTFIPELDDLLRDEVVAGAVTELTGFPGSGKTQVCFHLSVGVSGEVVFICTNRSFSSERVKGECLVSFEF
jgi:predicted ATP-dependent serine protease